MKTNTITESYVYVSEGYLDCIELSARQLREAKIGDEWYCYDANADCNATERWKTTVKVVFKDDFGVALLERCDYEDPDEESEMKLTWVELR